MYKRKTIDEFQIHGYYAGSWEEVTAEETRKEARARLREYRKNEPRTTFKLIVKRVPIAELIKAHSIAKALLATGEHISETV